MFRLYFRLPFRPNLIQIRYFLFRIEFKVDRYLEIFGVISNRTEIHLLVWLILGGGVYYTRVVHNMNNEFTEDKQVGMYGWLSVHKYY